MIVLVGKPNVGKSTLFNTLIGRKEAIVGSEPGLTRDFQEVKYSVNKNPFLISDTAGLKMDKNKLAALSNKFTIKKIQMANIVFFLIDGSNELTNEDYNCADFLRKYKQKVILLVNKVELKQAKNYENAGYNLGFGKPIQITGKSKLAKLLIDEIIESFLDKIKTTRKYLITSSSEKKKISIAISGKPNTGKSTLFNNIYGSNRVIVSSAAGTTRDSVREEICYKNYVFDLVDPAGMKKREKVLKKEIEKSANYFSRKEIRYANVVIFVFDATLPFSNLELTITNYIIKEGRAVLLVFNKWDLIKDKERTKKNILTQVNSFFFDIKNVPAIFMSAIKKSCKSEILSQIVSIHERWNKRLKTSDLNHWLRSEFSNESTIQSKKSRKTKFRYISQTKSRPPTFSLFCNTKKNLNYSKLRFLKNSLRNKFGLDGIPIRVNIKVSKNPYTDKS